MTNETKRNPCRRYCGASPALPCRVRSADRRTGGKANDFDVSVDESYHSNPIDQWRNEMIEEYAEYDWHWLGPISYEYKEAWKAEFEHRVQLIEGEEQAAAYLEAVEQEAEAITNLWMWEVYERNGGSNWGHGDSVASNESIAQVYKNAVFQWDCSTDYFFDPEAATEELNNWHY